MLMRKESIRVEVGQVYGYYTVSHFNYKDIRKRNHFYCTCKCGKVKSVQAGLLTSGNTKSCGCYGTEKRKARRISTHHSEVTAVILGYKRHASARGFMWELDREFVSKLILKACYYCDSPPSNFMKTKNSIVGLAFNGIDRVDSKSNYTVDNVVPCCKFCNIAKQNYKVEDFLNWAKRIATKWG